MHDVAATLYEYWSEGFRPQSRFGRIIVPLLAIKLGILGLLYLLFFGPSTQPSVKASAIDAVVFNLPHSTGSEPRP